MLKRKASAALWTSFGFVTKVCLSIYPKGLLGLHNCDKKDMIPF